MGMAAPERMVIVPSELFGPNASATNGFDGSLPCIALWIMYAVCVGAWAVQRRRKRRRSFMSTKSDPVSLPVLSSRR